jgi:hypothetical protein
LATKIEIVESEPNLLKQPQTLKFRPLRKLCSAWAGLEEKEKKKELQTKGNIF